MGRGKVGATPYRLASFTISFFWMHVTLAVSMLIGVPHAPRADLTKLGREEDGCETGPPEWN